MFQVILNCNISQYYGFIVFLIKNKCSLVEHRRLHTDSKLHQQWIYQDVCRCACVPSKLLRLLQSHNTVWNGSAAFCWAATWGQNALAFHIDSLIMTAIKVTGSMPLPNYLFKLNIQWHTEWRSLPCTMYSIMTLEFFQHPHREEVLSVRQYSLWVVQVTTKLYIQSYSTVYGILAKIHKLLVRIQ